MKMQLPLWLHLKHRIALELDETIAYNDEEDENNLPDEDSYPDEEDMEDVVHDQGMAEVNPDNRNNTNQA